MSQNNGTATLNPTTSIFTSISTLPDEIPSGSFIICKPSEGVYLAQNRGQRWTPDMQQAQQFLLKHDAISRALIVGGVVAVNPHHRSI